MLDSTPVDIKLHCNKCVYLGFIVKDQIPFYFTKCEEVIRGKWSYQTNWCYEISLDYISTYPGVWEGWIEALATLNNPFKSKKMTIKIIPKERKKCEKVIDYGTA